MLGCATLSFIINHNTYFKDCHQFSGIHISQGSVATYLRFGGMFKYQLFAMSLPCERILKIGQHLGKLWARV